jgi:lipopolysaccharide transport system permease protein
MATTTYNLVLKPRKGWQPINWAEIWLNRQLLGFLIWRDIKIRYRQTIFGGLWAILQPLMGMLIFTFFFHKLSGIASDGPPYPLFTFAGLTFWTFFSNAVGMASNSLIGNQVLISKVYFPRVFIPLGSIGALLLDLIISSVLMIGFMFYYRWPMTTTILWLPFVILGCALAASGLGLILSAWNVRFRDIKYAVPFMLQMGMFVTPVIYPIEYIPLKYRLLVGLNPMTGVVIAARYAFLGGAVQMNLIYMSLVVSLALFVAGLFVFRRTETQFADIV